MGGQGGPVAGRHWRGGGVFVAGFARNLARPRHRQALKKKDNMSREMKARLRQEYVGFGGTPKQVCVAAGRAGRAGAHRLAGGPAPQNPSL